jgi:hypothetical protein
MPDEKYKEKTEVKTEKKSSSWGNPETDEGAEYKKETTVKVKKEQK